VLNKKLNIPQLLITAFCVVTLITVSNAFIEWGSPIYRGMFAGGLFIVGIVVSKLIYKR
jgi:intracellular septation protein A